ncbi:hypothetical protein INT47_010335 [Mucor saturninus]|uniref:BTB domain-containing protein n=1 Tax=Mucor saturninus TaxID=64648 RepID=A0A8H7QJM4_9FUNG|nr:hypothetical protein INT47_010335 [Mucor saturninus]
MGETPMENPIVKINVGGKPFYTKQNTLVQSKYFEVLLANNMDKRIYVGKNSDEIFIDRNGDIFRHVLQYLRLGKIFVKEENTLKKVKIEANYYGLSDLENQVDARVKYLSESKDQYMFMDSDKLLEEYMEKFNPSSEKSTTQKAPKSLQVIKCFDTVEKQTKCFLPHTASESCTHTNHKTIEVPVKKAIVRRYA